MPTSRPSCRAWRAFRPHGNSCLFVYKSPHGYPCNPGYCQGHEPNQHDRPKGPTYPGRSLSLKNKKRDLNTNGYRQDEIFHSRVGNFQALRQPTRSAIEPRSLPGCSDSICSVCFFAMHNSVVSKRTESRGFSFEMTIRFVFRALFKKKDCRAPPRRPADCVSFDVETHLL